MSVVKWKNSISQTQIKDSVITNQEVSATAAIVESKLTLDKGTQDLYTNSVRIDEDRTVAESVVITLPASGFKWKDSVNGKTYLVTLQNGVMVMVES